MSDVLRGTMLKKAYREVKGTLYDEIQLFL